MAVSCRVLEWNCAVWSQRGRAGARVRVCARAHACVLAKRVVGVAVGLAWVICAGEMGVRSHVRACALRAALRCGWTRVPEGAELVVWGRCREYGLWQGGSGWVAAARKRVHTLSVTSQEICFCVVYRASVLWAVSHAVCSALFSICRKYWV